MTAGHILVVDDEDQLRSLLKRVISMEGYWVYEAADLKDAVRILKKEEIDVVVCDVKLPDGSGLDFTQTLRAGYPQMEIILLTGYANMPDVVRAMHAGVFDYMSKGDDDEKLLPMIALAAEKAHLQKRLARLEEQVAQVISFEKIGGRPAAIDQGMRMKQEETLSAGTQPVFDLASVEKQHIQRVLEFTKGNKAEAARLLNIGLTTVYRKMEEYDLHFK